MSKSKLEKPKKAGRILVVDDEEVILRVWRIAMERRGHQVYLFENGSDALAFLKQTPIDVAILDHMMPQLTGLELLKRIKAQWPEIEVIMMTGYASIETALEAMKTGAYDYLQKPFEQLEMAVRIVEKALERKFLIDRNRELEQRLDISGHYEGMVGNSPGMLEVFQMVEQVSGFDASVLIRGETGTGKEQVARAIHLKSLRAEQPFVPVVCGAIPESLIESTLFGHRKGAFTGATSDKLGLIEAADGGTLFLDEVGDIPLGMQIKLLRVLQEGEIQRLGDTQPTKVDVRVLAATHRDLKRGIAEGHFREDLYFRLNTIEIKLPPLRERSGDISLLAHHFLRTYGERYAKPIRKIDDDMLTALQQYGWPGNVRQLEQVINRAVILEMCETLTYQSLPPDLLQVGSSDELYEQSSQFQLTFRDAKQRAVQEFEKRYLRGVLARADNNISKAARFAGMDRANFRRLLKKYTLDTAKSRKSRPNPSIASSEISSGT